MPIGKDVDVHPVATGNKRSVGTEKQAAGVVIDCRAVSGADAHVQRNVLAVVLIHRGIFAQVGTVRVQCAAGARKILCIIQLCAGAVGKDDLTVRKVCLAEDQR